MKNNQLSKNFHLLFIVSLTLLSCNGFIQSDKSLKEKKDSVDIWIQQTKNESYSLEDRKATLNKAYVHVISTKDDRIKTARLTSIGYRYFYPLKDTLSFNKVNTEALKIAAIVKDTFAMGDIHWSYAEFHHNNGAYLDSYYHFNQAYQYFNSINKEFESARMIHALASIKGIFRDYTGSEVLRFQAIKKFKKLKADKRLYDSYKDLALIQIDLKKYDKAIEYNYVALDYLKDVPNREILYSGSYNNIGYTYFEKGDYVKAIEFYSKALKHKATRINRVRIIDNLAVSRLRMHDTTNVKRDIDRVSLIRDSLNVKRSIISSRRNKSEYYAYIKDTLKAISYAKQANLLAKSSNSSAPYLKTLKTLADLDLKNSAKYLNTYISYNDSLITAERKALNKFARIEFETDEIIEDNKLLTQQQIWITVTSVGVILILSLLYFLRTQRAKTEKLRLESEQQKANEEIYLLTLQQQIAFEKERTKERNRISEELHDGVLGKLFGTRMGLGFLEIKGTEDTKEKHQSFIEELQHIEKEIRDVSHQLNADFNSSQINFTTLVTQLVKSQSTTGNFKSDVSFDEHITWEHINEVVKVNAYRIIQEALMNIVKYASAKNVVLDFQTRDNQLVILVKDDGLGFNLKKNTKGIGIKNMKSRVQKLKGKIHISSEKSNGTSILIQIPIA